MQVYLVLDMPIFHQVSVAVLKEMILLITVFYLFYRCVVLIVIGFVAGVYARKPRFYLFYGFLFVPDCLCAHGHCNGGVLLSYLLVNTCNC